MKQNSETNLGLRNTLIPSSSFKSQRNLTEELVPNTATIITKPNFQAAGHDIIKKGPLLKDILVRAKL